MNSMIPERSDLLLNTILLSFAGVVFVLSYLKKELDLLRNQKKDIDTDDIAEKDVYQGWTGQYADGNDSLTITLIRKKISTKKMNKDWIDWDGTEDASLVSRNYYLGNASPSFEWAVEKREEDTKMEVRESMIDGWNSVIEMKMTAFVKEEMDANSFLKRLVLENQIEWEKVLFTQEEYEELIR